MNTIMELTFTPQTMKLFSFLKENPTAVYKKGNHYKFLYFEPLDVYISEFTYKGIKFRKLESKNLKLAGWKLVRDMPISLAKPDLITVLKDLEKVRIKENRQGTGIKLTGWILETLTLGLYTKQETALFVRLLYINGYSCEDIAGLFSAIVKRPALARYFIKELSNLERDVT